LERLAFTTNLEEAVVDTEFVTEVSVERQDVMHDVFSGLDENAHQNAILATIT